MPINEVYETLLDLPNLEYSFRPFEDLLRAAFTARLRDISTARDVNMFACPIRVLLFAYTHEDIPNRTLFAYTRWANDMSYAPNTLSQKRPTAQDLVLLQTLCENQGVKTHVLGNAIRNYLASGGGRQKTWLKPRPIAYQRKRVYVRCNDPCETRVPADPGPYKPEESTRWKKSKIAMVVVGNRPHGNVPRSEVSGPRGPQAGWRLRYALQRVWRDDGVPNKYTLQSRKANRILVK